MTTRLPSRSLSESERRWLRVRNYLHAHRFELGVAASRDYHDAVRIEGTPLLATSAWLPAEPVALAAIDLNYDMTAGPFHGLAGVEVSDAVLPLRPDGSHYRRYSEVVGELAKPGVFENRATFRLHDVDLQHSGPCMSFGPGNYFDGVDVGDACAHEFTAALLGETTTQPLRTAVGDPCDPSRRPTNVAISTLTIRHDRRAGAATFPLHRRDFDEVGHAGGMVQVIPVGIFQPASDEPWNVTNDFSLWRNMLREFAEELLGESEDHGSTQGPIDYHSWPFAAHMTGALDAGQIRAHVLGLGVDPLTLATDVLAVVVIDAPVYDELLGQHIEAGAEGSILAPLPFDEATVQRYATSEPTQAAGAALLRLSWRHRDPLLS